MSSMRARGWFLILHSGIALDQSTNKARLKSFLLECTGMKRQSAVKLIANVSKAALLGSFTVFSSRNETWDVRCDLSVNV